jgi:hypothetical protein
MAPRIATVLFLDSWTGRPLAVTGRPHDQTDRVSRHARLAIASPRSLRQHDRAWHLPVAEPSENVPLAPESREECEGLLAELSVS